MSDTRTIMDVCRGHPGIDPWEIAPTLTALGLDPDTVLERKCERCYGIGMLHETIGTIDHCPDCGGSGWVEINRVVVVPAPYDLYDDLRALRIGRAVLASERGGSDDDQIAQDLMAHFLAAGDNE